MKHQLIYDVSTVRNGFTNLFFSELEATERLTIESVLLKDFLLHRLHIIYCVPVMNAAFMFQNIDGIVDTLQRHTKHHNYQSIIRKCELLDTAIRKTMKPNIAVFSGKQITGGAIINDCFILELNK